jgi:hypothetical protein
MPPPKLLLHVTLFTRASCGLCLTARQKLAEAWEVRPFEYLEVDVAKDVFWRRAYGDHVPVVSVRLGEFVKKGNDRGNDGAVLMHRFEVVDILAALKDVEKSGKGA